MHLNTSSVDKFEKALDTAEQLMQTYADSDMGAEIEVVANASAVRMLRTGYSPYADRSYPSRRFDRHLEKRKPFHRFCSH